MQKTGLPNVIGSHCSQKVHVLQWEHWKKNPAKLQYLSNICYLELNLWSGFSTSKKQLLSNIICSFWLACNAISKKLWHLIIAIPEVLFIPMLLNLGTWEPSPFTTRWRSPTLGYLINVQHKLLIFWKIPTCTAFQYWFLLGH